MTKKDFLTEFTAHANWYSSYVLINTTIDKVIEALNKICPDACVGSGCNISGNIFFEISKGHPSLIYPLTKELNTIGYADTNWNEQLFICAKNGVSCEEYEASWSGDFEEGDDGCYDAFVDIKDLKSGAIFQIGEGAADKGEYEYYKRIVDTHTKK